MRGRSGGLQESLDGLDNAKQAADVGTDAYLSSIASDRDRIVACGTASMDSRVPSCPDWDVADLITHVGWVYRWFTYLATLPDGERGELPQAWAERTKVTWGRPEGDLVVWFGDAVDELIERLVEAPASKKIDWIYGVHDPSMLARRAATEITIHRWDAESAVGTPRPLDPALAGEGIDEFLELLVPVFFGYQDFDGSGQRIRLESPGGHEAWLITVDSDTTRCERGNPPTVADVTAQGSVSDLYLSCWRRPPADPVKVTGDKNLLARWLAAAAF